VFISSEDITKLSCFAVYLNLTFIRRVVGDGRNTLFWYDKWIGDILLRVETEFSLPFLLGEGKGVFGEGHGESWVGG